MLVFSIFVIKILPLFFRILPHDFLLMFYQYLFCSVGTQDAAWKSGGTPDVFGRGPELKGVVSESFCQVKNL